MITLKEKMTNKWLGSITEDQLQFLTEQLEEEYKGDQDYWVNRVILDVLKEKGADTSLIAMVESAMGDKDAIEFYWTES